ncbi:hypothetical protein ACFE04_023281 [Oxalis oulophora]
MATSRPRLARPVSSPFRLLELTIISAQDLAPIAKTMRTYGVAWVNPDRKLTTRVDQSGHCNPTWNDKFVFRVDDKFLSSEDSSIDIEVYTAAWLRDVLVGSVNVLIGNVFVDYYNNYKKGYNYSATTRFVALQIRRPSGRPQGILNVGFTLLDTTMKSMPLRSELSLSLSGDGSSDLLDRNNNNTNNNNKFQKIYDDSNNINHHYNNIIKLRRTQSDRTDLTISDDTFGVKPKHHDDSSMCGSSIMVGSSELNEKGGSMVNSSLCNSDVGPSASIVAAAIAKGLIKTPGGGNKEKTTPGGSILEGWTAKNKGEEEALKMKLERWRTEVPPVYDHQARKQRVRNRKRRQKRRESGNGLFSCFGNVFGCQISITCGGGNSKRRSNSNDHNNRNGKVFHLSAVDDTYSRAYA